jgi:hypothetical protein
MTDKKSFADKVRDHATDDDSPHAHHEQHFNPPLFVGPHGLPPVFRPLLLGPVAAPVGGGDG